MLRKEAGFQDRVRRGLMAGLLAPALISGCTRQDEGSSAPEFPVLTGDYLGQTLPERGAELFAPGIVSSGLNDRDTAISPDGSELYWSVVLGQQSTIVVMSREDDRWGPPGVAPFSGIYSDLEPAFSPDGSRLYFVSNRPLDGLGPPKADFDIWYTERDTTAWTRPRNPGPPINTNQDEFYPSLAQDGAIYFTAAYNGSEDIYCCHLVAGLYTAPQRLGDAVNTPSYEFNAYVAPDHSYLIFTSFGREGGLGGGDLYISFRGPGDGWQPAQHMGAAVNSAALDYCPYVSPDGRYFFFSSRRADERLFDPGTRISLAELRTRATSPGNGQGDVFWIATSAVDALRRENAGRRSRETGTEP